MEVLNLCGFAMLDFHVLFYILPVSFSIGSCEVITPIHRMPGRWLDPTGPATLMSVEGWAPMV